MLDYVLAFFPPHTHPLTLVSDPDAVLADEGILAILAERGFRLIAESDPVALRHAVQHAQPITAEAPVIILTPGSLEALPYDLWQQGYHITLDLHRLFPNLAYPALRELSPGQRHRLSEAQATPGAPAELLAYRDSLDYLLQTVFHIVPGQVRSPARLIAWLDEYHARNDPMSVALASHLIGQLRRSQALAGLPLDELVRDAEAYRRFIQHAWATFLQKQTREHADVAYAGTPALPFDTDRAIQDLLPRLVRNGSLAPVEVVASIALPAWTQPAIVWNNTDRRLQQFAEGLAWLEPQLGAGDPSTGSGQVLRWEQWQAVARRWAQLSIWRATPDLHLEYDQFSQFDRLQAALDDAFPRWIATSYAPLATRALPFPHHLHHVPGWLASRRQQQPDLRLALVIIDGMALTDWLQIRDVWQARHPGWAMDERLVLAQIPSITAISRQALISGRRPAQFEASLLHNRFEEQYWSTFWQSQGLPANASAYARLSTQRDAPYPDAMDSRRIQTLCLVSPVLDEKVHKETQGAVGWQATLGVWLNVEDGQHQPSSWIEGLLKHLFNLRYTVVVTSDHGHVEARGMGVPQEGVLVETRSKRARLYSNSDIVRLVQMKFADTILWQHDSLLPEQTQVLMPKGRRAFAPSGDLVVSHGGITLEELVVPLVTITQS